MTTTPTTTTESGLPAAVGIADLLRLIRRRLPLIAAVTLVLAALAAALLSRVAPRYTAEAQLMIENRGSNVANVEALIAGRSTDPETVISEIQVLKSTRLANQVITALGLDRRAEFNPALEDPDAAAEPQDAGVDMISGERVQVIDRFLDRLDVEPVPGSRAVSVSFSSEDPVLAARVANALVDAYLTDQLESKFEAVQRASGWLNERVASLREKVQESERRVEEFRESSGLLQGGGTTLTDQEVSQINAQVLAANNRRAEAEARLRQVRRLLASPAGVDSAGEVLNSPLIQRLREQEAGIRRRIAELGADLGERHPTMVQLRAEAADLNAKIDAEIGKIVAGLENSARIARSNEANLEANLEEAKQRVGENNKALVTLRALEREAEANRLVLESMLTTFTRTSEQDDLASQRPDARVIAEAVVPVEPSYPPKAALLAVVVILGGFIGLMLAFVLEFIDDAFRSGEQLESATGLRPLGFVPRIDRRTLAGKTPLEHFQSSAVSPFSESFRTLYSALIASGTGDAPKTVLVTSARPDEGKTTVAVCLGAMHALSGKRTIVVDADCRRPSVVDHVGGDSGPGLIDFVTGKAKIQDVVRKHADTGLHYIGAGKATRNPPATLSSPRFDEFLKLLRAHYDLVIVDSPPTMAVSDALVIAGKCDATVLTVRWGSTKQSAVRLAIRRLNDAGARIAGGLLTVVNARQYARYGYGDSGAYVGDLAEYHQAVEADDVVPLRQQASS